MIDLEKQTGVGFFGTISGNSDSSELFGETSVVRNIRLKDGTVSTTAVGAGVDETLINDVLVGLGTVLGTVLDPVLYLLTGRRISTTSMLTSLLNARAKDPTSLAAGAFAGRITGNAEVTDCEARNIEVTTVRTTYEEDGKIVGKGGFVGHIEGETKYDALSNILDAVQTALSSVLNIIPGLGLGDLITVLLDNALPVADLIPTGGKLPLPISRCQNFRGVAFLPAVAALFLKRLILILKSVIFGCVLCYLDYKASAHLNYS